ncbi:MAG: hypothetical protein KDK36_16050 [Leptospiraceae bacterium]|nr:hypothetical protein [Leptospiraceae bacterium]
MLHLVANDEKVVESFTEFTNTGNTEPFSLEASIWVMNHIKEELAASDDEISDVFFHFSGKIKRISEFAKKRNYNNIVAYLAVYSKNLLRNIRRKKGSKENLDYLQIWNYDKQESDLRASSKSIRILRKILKKINRLDRIIISLRFNLNLNQSDMEFLLYRLKELSREPELFIKNKEEKILSILGKQEKILERVNLYSRRIYYENRRKYKRDNRERKKLLIDKASAREELFSVKEISELLSISRYKVNKICRTTINLIKKEYEKKLAA